MKSLILLIALILPITPHAQEAVVNTTNSGAASVEDLNTKLQSQKSQYQTLATAHQIKIQAIADCGRQSQLWNGTTCIPLHTIITSATVYTQTQNIPAEKGPRCYDHIDRGSSRNLAYVYDIYTCPFVPNQVEISGTEVTITQPVCSVTAPKVMVWGGQARYCSLCHTGIPTCASIGY